MPPKKMATTFLTHLHTQKNTEPILWPTHIGFYGTPTERRRIIRNSHSLTSTLTRNGKSTSISPSTTASPIRSTVVVRNIICQSLVSLPIPSKGSELLTARLNHNSEKKSPLSTSSNSIGQTITVPTISQRTAGSATPPTII